MGRKYDAILYLDVTWQMFLYPYASLMQGSNSNQRNNPIFVQKILDTFKNCWLSHPIFKKTSELHSEFQYLQHLIDEWKNKRDEEVNDAINNDNILTNTAQNAIQSSFTLKPNNAVCFINL